MQYYIKYIIYVAWWPTIRHLNKNKNHEMKFENWNFEELKDLFWIQGLDYKKIKNE